MSIVTLKKGAWAILPMSYAALIRQKKGSSPVFFSVSQSIPASSDMSNVTIIDKTDGAGDKVDIKGIKDGWNVYAYTEADGVKIEIVNLKDPSIPEGAFYGERAMTIQGYPEINKKRGLEWEASRRVLNVDNGQKLYSIIRVGSKNPIDLKSRILGATGSGVIGRIYELFPADIDTWGNPDPFYNMRFDLANPAMYQPDTKIYVEANVRFAGGLTAADFATDARKRGADIDAETNPQKQGTGFLAIPTGSNRILYQDSIALLEIQSLDAAQNVNARLEIYEGPLDWPLP